MMLKFIFLCLIPVINCMTLEERFEKLEKHVENQEKHVGNLEKHVENLEIELATAKEEKRSQQNVVGFSFYQTDEYVDYVPGNRIQFKGEITNYGGDFDPGQSQFNCPVNGYYYVEVFLDCMHDHRHLGAIYRSGTLLATANGHSNTQRQASMAVMTYCGAGQSLYVDVVDQNSRIYNYNSLRTSVFTGFLLSLA